MRRRSLLALMGGGLLLAAALPAQAHRAKSSLTLVRWNAAAKLLEVEHKLHAHDAEVALSQQAGIATPDLSRLEDQAKLALYVEARFSLTPLGGKPLSLKLLGAELEGDHIFVYQELALPAPPKALAVEDGILRDVFRTQLNQVNFDMADGDPAHIRTLTFNGQDKAENVTFDR
ncbi:DUF6702 family protein [Niveispirillum sp. SYP-B3756]|uniref:DUF6702 family protein n=1 Tax=Niveispirillum sp. SYP-B3756 TaxID=2662178 RepID=UPI0012926C31|nr:DUF6702 family protein [Niveispirillum sp. SYP-B3756]